MVGGLYEWSCSPLDGGNESYTLPDLGEWDSVIVFSQIGTALQLASLNNVDIYPVPPTLNCSGTVSAVKYCYGSSETIGINSLVFTLLILEKNGLRFRVTDVIQVQHRSNTNCIAKSRYTLEGLIDGSDPQYCCSSMNLEQFHIPQPNFAFAVVPAHSIIAYNPTSFPDYKVEKYSFPKSVLHTLIAVGDTFTLTNTSRRTNESLLVIQFVISKPTFR